MKAVLIEWTDIYGGCRVGWRSLDSMIPKPVKCRSYGEIVRENVDEIVIVPHLSVVDGDTLGDGEITIPKADIIRTVELIEKAQEA